jgi:hypothetical protein
MFTGVAARFAASTARRKLFSDWAQGTAATTAGATTLLGARDRGAGKADRDENKELPTELEGNICKSGKLNARGVV